MPKKRPKFKTPPRRFPAAGPILLGGGGNFFWLEVPPTPGVRCQFDGALGALHCDSLNGTPLGFRAVHPFPRKAARARGEIAIDSLKKDAIVVDVVVNTIGVVGCLPSFLSALSKVLMWRSSSELQLLRSGIGYIFPEPRPQEGPFDPLSLQRVGARAGFPLVGGPAGTMEAGRQQEVAKLLRNNLALWDVTRRDPGCDGA